MVIFMDNTNFITPPFYNRRGILYLENVNLVKLLEDEGSPLLVTSEKRLRNNYFSVYNSFSKLYGNFRVNYAVKANSNPAIISVFRKLGAGVDVGTLGEVFIARFSGIDKEKIMFSPNYASKSDLELARGYGIIINFDDVRQFEFTKDNLPQITSFRINPGMGGGDVPGNITGGPGSKFGIPDKIALKVYKKAKDLGVKRFGIHMHGGSNNLDPEYFKKITKKFFEIASKIRKDLKIDFEFIDIGGGFGVPYRLNESPLNMNLVAEFIIENFKEKYLKGNDDPLLIVEPGRFLVANSTVLLGRINSIKNYDKKFIGTDIGMNLLIRPALYGAFHHMVLANKLDSPITDKVTIVGPICENTDKIAENREFPHAEVDDIVCVFNAGAYVYTMSSNYNSLLRPKEILISENSTVFTIRERESYVDLVRGSRIPPYLMF